MDNTNINEKYPIDSLVATYGILEHIEGYKLVNNNEIIYSNHRRYVINTNLEEHFKNQFSE